MEVEAFQRLAPEGFYKRFVSKGIRPDGRKFHEIRKMNIDLGVLPLTHGSAMVRLGATKAVAAVSLQIGQPATLTPNCGEISVGVALRPLCHPNFPASQHCRTAQQMESFLTRLLNTCGIVSPESLCITPGAAAWRVCIDILCLNHQGNLIDVCLAAAVSALRCTRLPQLEAPDHPGGAYQIHPVGAGESRALELVHIPVALTLGVFPALSHHSGTTEHGTGDRDTPPGGGGGKMPVLVADPSLLEEGLMESVVTVVRNERGQINAVFKPGGCKLPGDCLNVCLALCTSQHKIFSSLLAEATAMRNRAS
uniref:Ribosomal RNA-processing protein 43 n=1 Tax=Fibrocapsa japonica TaxID=94617 RepID=A0A6U1QCI5_9STRA